MFEVKNELDNGFRVLCNDTSVVSGIPSQALADRIVAELRQVDWIDWGTFPLELYMPEQLAIGSIIEKIRLESEA
jgi:hypothetical protein